MKIARLIIALGMAVTLLANAVAQNPPSPAATIDRFVADGWKQRQVTPSASCDDRAFVRRAYLDLAGGIPTLEEAQRFVNDTKPDKRAALVDALLASDDYSRHMAEVFDVILMERRGELVEFARHQNKWFEFLQTSFRTNRPWSEVVRALIVARPTKPEERGAVWFLYERKDNFQEMAEAIAPIAFGTQVKCAQCHNHMLAREIEQKYYWALVAAFNRSKPVNTPNGPAVAESAVGGFISFANLRKESAPATLTFLNGKSVPEERPAEGAKEPDTPDKYVVPPTQAPAQPAAPAQAIGKRRMASTESASVAAVPKFSRRESLADAVTKDNPLLARAMVNRMWGMLLGRGIVHPVDEMNSKYSPSHPELLDWLAQDFEASGYDVKRLIRGIVLSRAYQLDSRASGDHVPPEAFAHALEKPLSAEQLYRSLRIATGHQPDGAIDGLDANRLRQLFIAQFPDLFPVEYNASLQQAMFLTNNPLLDELLKPREGNTTQKLAAITDVKERARVAFGTVYGRAPDTDELKRAADYLSRRQPEVGVRQLLWALLTSAEFMTNH